MSAFSVILIGLSILPCILSFWAARRLWQDKIRLPGSIFPILFCFANGVYSAIFTGLLIVSSFWPEQDRVPLIVIWILIYLFQQVTYSMMALFFIGRVDDHWLRRILRVKPGNHTPRRRASDYLPTSEKKETDNEP